MENEKYNDEIDLIEVFNNLLKSTYFFFNRWYKTLALSIIIGVILGGAFYLLNKSKYQNTMTGYSPVINTTLIVNMINSLNNICISDKISLQNILNLTPTEADKIIDFNADTVRTNPKGLLTIIVQLRYQDSINIDKFTNNLIKYINDVPYVKKELNIRKERLGVLIEQTDKEIIKLDSLQKALLINAGKKPTTKNGSLIISNDQVSNFYHGDILKLTEKKQAYLANLQHITGFEPINRFEPAKIKDRSLIKTIAATTGIIFGITFFVLLIIEIRRKAIRLIKK